MAQEQQGRPKLKVVEGRTHAVISKNVTKKQEREYFRRLHLLVDQIFERATSEFDWSWTELAKKAGLTYRTVKRLGDRETLWPRLFTVHQLARAVKMEVEIVEVKEFAGTKMKRAAG